MLGTVLCKFNATELTAIIVSFSIILSFPFLYRLFGKEDKCGRTLWDKIRNKKK